jgi:hypothetical protein
MLHPRLEAPAPFDGILPMPTYLPMAPKKDVNKTDLLSVHLENSPVTHPPSIHYLPVTHLPSIYYLPVTYLPSIHHPPTITH